MRCHECAGSKGWWARTGIGREEFIRCPACHGLGVHIDEHPDEECRELELPDLTPLEMSDE